MASITVFDASCVAFLGTSLLTGRRGGMDVILTQSDGPSGAELGLQDGTSAGEHTIFPASYENMLVWERRLAPERRLLALNRAGYCAGFGAGNRVVVSSNAVGALKDRSTCGAWDGVFRAMLQTSTPYWFVQQSIVRELIPEGVDPEQYPGIGHTGGYGPRELLRAGLFAFASLGGYSRYALPIGADADHAIVVGHDEQSLHDSLAFNKLAMEESSDYTKFTVDVSQLFGFPVTITRAEERRVLSAFRARPFRIPNVLTDKSELAFEFDEAEALRLALRYWRAAAVHKELYDHASAVREGRPFDYELSLDETPEAMPPRELLFYLVLLEEVLGLPPGGVASAGPNLGWAKRHDFEGDLQDLWTQTNACASILHHRGAMLSVHSADGVSAWTGKGRGVDQVLAGASGARLELKVADVYQEVLWEVLQESKVPQERELFVESWRRTYEAASTLAMVYRGTLAQLGPQDARQLLATPQGCEQVARQHGAEALRLAQGAIGYGLALFELASKLLESTDPAHPRAEDELFRRFMFLPYRGLRMQLFQGMTHEGWERFTQAVEQATLLRTRAMGWSN